MKKNQKQKMIMSMSRLPTVQMHTKPALAGTTNHHHHNAMAGRHRRLYRTLPRLQADRVWTPTVPSQTLHRAGSVMGTLM